MSDGEAAGEPALAFGNTVGKTLVAWRETGGLYLTLFNEGQTPYQLPVNPETSVPAGASEEIPHHPAMVYSFAWSPDGLRLAFIVGRLCAEPAIAIYSADGRLTASQKVAQPGECIPKLWWAQDGREVEYRSKSNRSGVFTLMALDPSSGVVRESYPQGDSLLQVLQVSANGRNALYWDNRGMPDRSKAGWAVGENSADVRLVVPAVDSDGVFSNYAELSPGGDQLVFTRQANPVDVLTEEAGAAAGSLWVAESDGSRKRKLDEFLYFRSAVWDPSGRFIAYTVNADLATTVLRIVDVTTGVVREEPLPNGGTQEARVTDWSRDGRFLGIVAQESEWEYWVLQGLQSEGR